MPLNTHEPPYYCGRFAPSPTGPLHFGSLIAAVGSYLQARSRGGQWLVRMEDLDPPREVAGAADDILRTMELYGFEWDGSVLYQSSRHEAYLERLDQLRREGLAYPCNCSRKEIAGRQAGEGGTPGIYPGTCRGKNHQAGRHAIRVITQNKRISFSDGIQGDISQNMEEEVGDFVIYRADGLHAYQLAVVIDDAEQSISEIVRGSDLLDSTVRQIYLQQVLGFDTLNYLHLPIAINDKGQKLSKQTHAPALDKANPLPALWQALKFLGQAPTSDLDDADLDSFWQWAIENWRVEAVPQRLAIPFPLPGS